MTSLLVDLTHIELTTDEDKAYGIDRWTRLFKATAWEKLKMISKSNPALTDASESLYVLNADELTRARCLARQEYIIHENAPNRKIEELTTENKELATNYEAVATENERLRAKLAKYEAKNV